MRDQLATERQRLAGRQRTITRRESEIQGATKSLQATRAGLTSQVGIMTSKLERLLHERTELDSRQEQLTNQLAGDDDSLKDRLQLALDELDYERRARNIEREQLAGMASQFNHVQEQLTQEQERFLATLNSLSDRETGAEIDLDELTIGDDVFAVEEAEFAGAVPTATESVTEEVAVADRSDDAWFSSADTEKADAESAEPATSIEKPDDDDAVSVVELTQKAREAGNDEEKQLQAFRGMLSSMFGMKRPRKQAEDKVSTAEAIDTVAEEAVLVEDAEAEEESHDPLAVEEPEEHEIPAWAKEAAPTGPVVDRVTYRSGEEQDDGRRSSETRTLARRQAMNELREVANESARSALATHSQHKLRRRMWMDGTLACISLGMGGAYLTQESPQALWVTCG